MYVASVDHLVRFSKNNFGKSIVTHGRYERFALREISVTLLSSLTLLRI